MNANELADYLDNNVEAMIMSEQQHIDKAATMLRQQQHLIDILNGRIERMIEKQSHYESMAHADGFEAGRQQGMKQERALWELAASTQEIMDTHPVKEEHFEDEPQAEELHEIMQSNTHPVKEQDESFDRTASHMAGEYVSYKAELTDEEIIEIGLLTTDPRFSHIESPLLLEFARAILRKAQEK